MRTLVTFQSEAFSTTEVKDYFTNPCCFGDDDTSGNWFVEVERDVGFFRFILGGARKGIAPSAVSAVHEALDAPEISNMRWHERANFDAGNEELGTPYPYTTIH